MKDEKETKDVVLVQAPGALTLGNLSTPEAVEIALRHVEGALAFKDGALKLLLKSARPGSITNMQGKPHMNEAECERLISFVGGATIGRPEVEKIPLEGGHYGIQTIVAVSHGTFGTFHGLGYCDSRDQFLGENLDPKTEWDNELRRKVVVKDEDGNTIPKRTLEDVREHNIRQMSFTRAKGSAIRKMLSLTALTWEDLAQYGIRPGKGAEVVFGKPQTTKTQDTENNAPPKKPARSPKAEAQKPPEPDRASMLRDEIKGLVNRKLVTVDEVAAWAKEIGVTGYVQDCADVEMLATLLKTCEAAIEGKKE